MSNGLLLKKVKDENQDFEWYPTTREIINKVSKDISLNKHKISSDSILDVGAGNGKLFKILEEYGISVRDKYAIEKSQVLIQSLDEDIFVIGTDFHHQTFIDKEVDIIFCNPPYSEYDVWTERLIREANCKVMYLVIPERWKNNKAIQETINLRKADAKVLGSFDFESSEDRKARAKVSLLRVAFKEDYGKLGTDPFDIYFNEVFKMNADKKSQDEWSQAKEKREKLKELVKGKNLIEHLEELYNKEMSHLHDNYKKVAELDSELLKELNVSTAGLKEALKIKIQGLKNLYWQELFDNLETITSRLTSSSRNILLTTLTKNTSVDFTASNAYSIVIWAIKNANKYYDSQLLEVYKDLTKPDNVRLYKSNHRIVKDGWKFERREIYNDEISKYALDYRIVDDRANALDFDIHGEKVRGLNSRTQVHLEDIFTIAKNLGFDIDSTKLYDTDRFGDSTTWQPGKKVLFYTKSNRHPLKKGQKTNLGKIEESFLQNGENGDFYQYLIDGNYIHESLVKIENDLFLEVKAFKNGNLHYKFNQKFMKALNVEAARLHGWIKSPKEASEEFDITEKEASEFFRGNFIMLPSTMKNLLPHTAKKETSTKEKTIVKNGGNLLDLMSA